MNDAEYDSRPEDGRSSVAAGKFRSTTIFVVIRALLCLPLLCASLLFIGIAFVGASKLPPAERAFMPGHFIGAAETTLICLVLAAPAAAFRPSLLWLLPLSATASAGAAGWALLPVPANEWMPAIEGAVLLLPVMVLVTGAWWRQIPPELADTAATIGASPARVFILARLRPAFPGLARGLAVVFVLALGLAPLLAPASGTP